MSVVVMNLQPPPFLSREGTVYRENLVGISLRVHTISNQLADNVATNLASIYVALSS